MEHHVSATFVVTSDEEIVEVLDFFERNQRYLAAATIAPHFTLPRAGYPTTESGPRLIQLKIGRGLDLSPTHEVTVQFLPKPNVLGLSKLGPEKRLL